MGKHKDVYKENYEPQMTTFKVDVTQTLVKEDVEIETDDFVEITEVTEDGNVYVKNDTQDTDWDEEYNSSHYTIPELLEALAICLDEKLKDKDIPRENLKKFRQMRKDCEGWKVLESEYEVNE